MKENFQQRLDSTLDEPPKRAFPCPFCKGEYQDTDYIDGYTVVLGECGVCDYGMIEVGSETHMKLKRNSATRKAIELFGGDKLFDPTEFRVIGEIIQAAVESRGKKESEWE